MSILIRNEFASDFLAIERVILAAYQHSDDTDHTEHLAVRQLRNVRELSVSLVAEEGGSIIGHVAASQVTICGGDSALHALSPISVDPNNQNRQIGSWLIKRALKELRTIGAVGCVVLGDPAFFARFGFKTEASLALLGAPTEYFQAIFFKEPLPSGVVAYHPAFAANV